MREKEVSIVELGVQVKYQIPKSYWTHVCQYYYRCMVSSYWLVEGGEHLGGCEAGRSSAASSSRKAQTSSSWLGEGSRRVERVGGE
jgi:hypothetical protein